ncbi:MAG: hypothetical protein PUC66_03300 [Erysipelotrichaceae bacterium]|nr:hypothetical protein [Erysipelotrichaceae bacterium]
MKTKAKLVLGLSILTAATLTAGATGTFAWFTTNRTATMTYQNIVAQSVGGNLEAHISPLSDTAATTTKTTDGVEETLTGKQSYTADVSSGDGIKFAQPKWKTIAGNDQAVYSVADVSANTSNKYYTSYYIALKNKGVTGSKSLNVYLTSGSAITPAATVSGAGAEADGLLASWTRVALNRQGVDTPTKDNAKAEQTIILNGTSAGNAYVTSKAAEIAKLSEDKDAYHTVTDGTYLESGKVQVASDNTNGKQFVATIAAQATVNVRVTVWMEGTAANNQDKAIGAAIDVKLVFSSFEAA